MPLIAQTAGAWSRFPAALDTFPVREDGRSLRSIVSAEALNKIEGALVQLQALTQQLLHTAPGNRKRVTLAGPFTLGLPTAAATVVVALGAEAKRFLGGALTAGAQVHADVRLTDGGAGAFWTDVAPSLSYTNGVGVVDTLAVRVTSLDGANLPAGLYQARLTLWGD